MIFFSEDYLVEALELVEIYCDLLIARFGIINQVKNLDEGISEAVSSILYAAPILQNDIPVRKNVLNVYETYYQNPNNIEKTPKYF